MTDDPVIIERRDEILAGDSPADESPADPESPADESLAGDPAVGDATGNDRPGNQRPANDRPSFESMGEVGTASDELIGRHAAADSGGADPADLVLPPEVPSLDMGLPVGAPARRVRPGRARHRRGRSGGAGIRIPGPGGSGSGGSGSGGSGSGGSWSGESGSGGGVRHGPRTGASLAAAGAPEAAVPGDRGPAAGDPGAGIPAAALSEQQWPAIQAMFVDDPQASVRRAAAAADEVLKAFVASLEREQAALRSSWENGNGTTTEDLRTALQQYRAFCGRLEGLA